MLLKKSEQISPHYCLHSNIYLIHNLGYKINKVPLKAGNGRETFLIFFTEGGHSKAKQKLHSQLRSKLEWFFIIIIFCSTSRSNFLEIFLTVNKTKTEKRKKTCGQPKKQNIIMKFFVLHIISLKS